MKVGVIGNGYVGGAVAKGLLALGDEVLVWDCLQDKATHTLEETCKAEFVFVCVPTPSPDGEQDLSAVNEMVLAVSELNPDAIILMKSTVVPGTCDALSAAYKIPVVSNPEFLSARTADQDFLDPNSIVAGHPERDVRRRVGQFYAVRFPDVPLFLYASCTEAEFVKYARNTFFALKVSYMNQLYDLATSLGVPWDSVKDGLAGSGWVSPMHTQVPGPDGKRGFGGACLPKDSEALVAFAPGKLTILEAALEANRSHRGD